MRKLFLALTIILFTSSNALGDDKEAIWETLDNLHIYASKAMGKEYFDLYTQDGVFLGTDVTERWPITDFKAYAMKRFDTGVGWTYSARERNIDIIKGRDVAYFDEVLNSQSYGTARGSGVLVKMGETWKIAQYHLTYPIPNDLSKKLTAEINAYYAKQK